MIKKSTITAIVKTLLLLIFALGEFIMKCIAPKKLRSYDIKFQSNDTQQFAMYACEQSTAYFKDKKNIFADMKELGAWLEDAINTDFVRGQGVDLSNLKISPKKAHAEDGGECVAVANAIHNIMWFAPVAMTKPIVIHELAHLLNNKSEVFYRHMGCVGLPRPVETGEASHGKSFCAIYLNLIKYFMGEEDCAELKSLFIKKGIEF